MPRWIGEAGTSNILKRCHPLSVRIGSWAPDFKMNNCQHLSSFMKTQLEIVKKHLDEHKYLRKIEDKNEALDSFIKDYGWLIRELYCTKICEQRVNCSIAEDLKESGDLLSKHIKK